MPGKMHRETLRGYLHNFTLVRAINQKRDVDDIRKKLLSAIQTLREVGLGGSVTGAVQQKYEEYSKTVRGYGNMIEDVWGITWQSESLIQKYIDCNDDDIDKLPEYVGLS